MAGPFVTISTFASLKSAEAAQRKLEAAGIQASVTDTPPAFTLWSYATATGDVRLVVLQEEAERAAVVLELEIGASGDLDPEQLVLEAEAAQEEAGGECTVETPWEGERVNPDETDRDRWEVRLFVCACASFLCPPLNIVGIVIFWKVAFMEESLSRGSRIRFYISGVLLVLTSCFWLLSLKHNLTK